MRRDRRARPRSGEAVKAFVVKKDPNVTAEDMIKFCGTQLTNYKVPKQIEFRADLPKTNVGRSCAAHSAMKRKRRRPEVCIPERAEREPGMTERWGGFPSTRKWSKTRPHIQGEMTMTIKVGDKLPEAKFRVMTAEGPQVKTTDDIFKGKKVALFAVPGAYTGTCHKMHLPSIFLNAYAIKGKGVNSIAIVSVNDAFVMNAWKRDTDQRDEAVFLADGNAEFTRAIGMELDASGNGLGVARIATRCWSMTAWSRNSTASRRPARSTFPAATPCSDSCKSDRLAAQLSSPAKAGDPYHERLR